MNPELTHLLAGARTADRVRAQSGRHRAGDVRAPAAPSTGGAEPLHLRGLVVPIAAMLRRRKGARPGPALSHPVEPGSPSSTASHAPSAPPVSPWWEAVDGSIPLADEPSIRPSTPARDDGHERR